ncbi:MAG: hydantoinase/oxoprolinase family protein, partial [Hyphomicrobiales bacterium]
ANPLHEQAVAQVLADAFDFVSLSHEISPEAREFERTATTVVNASLMPMVSGYMDRLTKRVPPSVTVRLFHSAGGMTSPAHVRERPLSLALSGPAAGASGAAAVAGELGPERAISFDMGGTTTDVCLILDGQVEISSDRRIAGRPIRQPIAAIETIGAGGGSIISLRSGGLFVGPESAGADPGPACYGFGGDRATIADADLVLGYLDHERPLAGKIRLDPEAARRALAPLAESLSLNVEAAAGGISQVAHATMARAVRRVSVERGIDTRQCALIAFGGAGPMHACGLADATQIDTIVVPAASGGFSALGCVTAKASFSHQQTVRLASRSWCPDLFHRLRSEITGKARDPLLEVGHSPDAIRIEEVALVRYAGQSGTAEVPVAAGDGRAEIDHAFHAAHERLYGFSTGEDWIVESYRVSARESAERPVVDGTNAAGPHGALADATCWFSDLGACQTPRLWRSNLEPGKVFKGPMLILDDWSTTVVDFGFEVSATPAGHLVLRRRAV